MGKRELVNIISEMLLPIGFKRKGNYWVVNGDAITKIVNLQKSSYSDSYYINYGYIINSIPLGKLMMHVYNRVTSLEIEERKKIESLLDLESVVSDNQRAAGLREMLQVQLVERIESVNSEDDLLRVLKKRSHLNDITLAVKQHFNLEY